MGSAILHGLAASNFDLLPSRCTASNVQMTSFRLQIGYLIIGIKKKNLFVYI
jgi:hypothetical protein